MKKYVEIFNTLGIGLFVIGLINLVLELIVALVVVGIRGNCTMPRWSLIWMVISLFILTVSGMVHMIVHWSNPE